jgi:HlyD family secretion protein
MPEPKQQLFRTKALERANSPDNLDQIIEIVTPRDWLPLAVLGVLLLFGLIWSVKGEIPTTVTGRGILTHPRGVVDVQTLGAGKIASLALKSGAVVRAGETIGHLDQFDLRKRLDEDEAQLAKLRQQDTQKATIQTERTRLQQEETRLSNSFIESQTANLNRVLSDALAMEPILKKHVTAMHALRDRGLVAALAPELIAAEQADVDNTAKMTDAKAKLRELDLQRAQSQASETGLVNDTLDAETARRNQMQELTSRIAVNRVALDQNSDIIATRTGRVLEVLTVQGQIVSTGARIATIQADGTDDELQSVSYFAVGDGKRIHVNDRVQVTPDTAERQRFGGITGRVISVSTFPVTADGARPILGSSEVVQSLLAGGPRVEVIAVLDRDPNTFSRFHWSSSGGPALAITPGLTGSMRVTVESRAPITYVLPFLKDITGAY